VRGGSANSLSKFVVRKDTLMWAGI